MVQDGRGRRDRTERTRNIRVEQRTKELAKENKKHEKKEPTTNDQ